MNDNLQQFLSGIKVGARQAHKNMTVFCLLAAKEADVDVITLDEAFDKRLLTVTELDEAGRVSELKVVNSSDRKILMMDGEELVGAKQNRVLNATVLIAAHSETIIPVSCVEQGRWSYRSREFTSEGKTISADLKRKKTVTVAENLRAVGSFASAQHLLWDEIEAKFERMTTPLTPTRAMSDLYEAHSVTSADYLKAFFPVDNQIGVVVFVEGDIAGIELLGRFDAFKRNHAKLIHSYVMDALETAVFNEGHDTKASKAKAGKILESTVNAAVQRRKSVGLGEDVRLESDEILGAGLEFEGQLLQMSIFLRRDEMSSPRPRPSLRRASSRRSWAAERERASREGGGGSIDEEGS